MSDVEIETPQDWRDTARELRDRAEQHEHEVRAGGAAAMIAAADALAGQQKARANGHLPRARGRRSG